MSPVVGTYSGGRVLRAVLSDEMLTIEDLAVYLKLKPQTIYKWAQSGKVPGAKFGKEWRFRKSDIERWIDERMHAGAEDAASGGRFAGGGGIEAGAGVGATSEASPRDPTTADRRDGAGGGEAPLHRIPREDAFPAAGMAGLGRTSRSQGETAGVGAVGPEVLKAAEPAAASAKSEPETVRSGVGPSSRAQGTASGKPGVAAAGGAGASGAEVPHRSGMRAGAPVEKVVGPRKGSRTSRRERGPGSN